MDVKAENIANSVRDRLRDGESFMRMSRTDRLLYLMRDGKWHMDTELADTVGWRFGSAIYSIRHDLGIDVELRAEPEPRPGKRRRNQYRVA